MNTGIPSMESSSKILVVVLHAWSLKLSSLRYVRKTIEEELPGSDIFMPPLPIGTWSMADPAVVARQVREEIERKVAVAENHYREIILVGHSMGALLARRVYVDAVIAETEEDAAKNSSRWSHLVSRIVLLAGMNRGWSISHQMEVPRAIVTQIGSMVGELIFSLTGKRLLILTIKRGAVFITQLRLDWLKMERSLKQQNRRAPLTIQLLGSIDDVVSPEDNVDMESGRSFIYLDVPMSGHSSVVEMNRTTEGQARRKIFYQALRESETDLRKTMLTPADNPLEMHDVNLKGDAELKKGGRLDDTDSDVDHVIFVIHGIRDTGYWTQKIAREVQRQGNKPPKIYASQTSSYGYFAMFPFLLRTRRQHKVEWLMDRYVEAKSRYPEAKFSYVGHSNGTYLLAKALIEYPGCQFENVVFAGSVVRRNYDWRSLLAAGKVKAVLNYVATSDWVVACFPGALEMLGLQDLGSAGHNGFDQMHPADGALNEVFYVRGGHGAALEERMWGNIARFVTTGLANKPEGACLSNTRKGWVTFLGRVAPLVWLGIITILASISVLIWKTNPPDWRTLYLMLFWLTIWKVLTRV